MSARAVINDTTNIVDQFVDICPKCVSAMDWWLDKNVLRRSE